VRSSLPVLVLAATISALAGVVLERRLDAFTTLPALLILVPAHLSSAGALGGILSGRLSSQLFLGTAPATLVPSRAARRDLYLVIGLSVPVFAFNALGTSVTARLVHQASPGTLELLAVSILGGAMAMVVVLAIAYYGTIAAVRTGIDPDTYGIPIVSSSVDLIGALTVIVTATALHII
jgi:mgtE-like transporter